jgi:hypothetical protein
MVACPTYPDLLSSYVLVRLSQLIAFYLERVYQIEQMEDGLTSPLDILDLVGTEPCKHHLPTILITFAAASLYPVSNRCAVRPHYYWATVP